MKPKKTQQKNLKDDRPIFLINMGYTSYRMAKDHLKLVMNKESTKWSEDDESDPEAKLAGQLEWLQTCVDKALEAEDIQLIQSVGGVEEDIQPIQPAGGVEDKIEPILMKGPYTPMEPDRGFEYNENEDDMDSGILYASLEDYDSE